MDLYIVKVIDGDGEVFEYEYGNKVHAKEHYDVEAERFNKNHMKLVQLIHLVKSENVMYGMSIEGGK